MNDVPRRALQDIINKYGTDICSDAKRCKGLLRDGCGSFPREINILSIAIEERIPRDLLASGHWMPHEMLLTRLAKHLEEHLALTEEAANWAVESWALALHIVSEAEVEKRENKRSTFASERGSAVVPDLGFDSKRKAKEADVREFKSKKNPQKQSPTQRQQTQINRSRINTLPPKSPPLQSLRRNNRAHLIYAVAGLFVVLIVVIGIASLLKPRERDVSSTNTNVSSVNSARTRTSPTATSARSSSSSPASEILDELNGSSIGDTYGITYADAVDRQGAVFSREQESRIQYRNIPSEGTLEWWINVSSGYNYSDFKLNQNQSNALIFTTVGGDVWYPGSNWFNVQLDGKLSLNMATTKYDGPTQLLIAPNTNFRFNQWHSIGISFGSDGQYIMLDGVLVASAPQNTQKLGRGGTHESSVDIPTIGELVSGFWVNNRYDAGFEGIVDRFRISNRQQDWYLSVQSPK